MDTPPFSASPTPSEEVPDLTGPLTGPLAGFNELSIRLLDLLTGIEAFPIDPYIEALTEIQRLEGSVLEPHMVPVMEKFRDILSALKTFQNEAKKLRGEAQFDFHFIKTTKKEEEE